MSYLAYLEFEANGAPGGRGWLSTVDGEGLEVRPFSGRDLNAALRDFVANAAGLWLPSDTILHASESAAILHEAIGEGKRLMVNLDPNQLSRLNDFVEPYGIEGTRIGIYTAEQSTGHTRLIRVLREDSPRSFRDEHLLKGVDSVVIQQPQMIRYGGDATPVLTIPLVQAGVYSLDTDFPKAWTSPEVTCLALGEDEASGGGVLAISGTLFHDPYVGPLGDQFPGISENRRLATNVIQWLTAPSDNATQRATTAFQLIDRIERSLAEYAQIVLSLQLPDWWGDGVPIAVRQKCGRRRAQEGNQLPESAYLDLSDIGKIVAARSQDFEDDMARAGWSGGIAGILARLDALNAIRRHVMHPSRRLFSGIDVSDVQLTELRQQDGTVAQLLRAARNRRRRARSGGL